MFFWKKNNNSGVKWTVEENGMKFLKQNGPLSLVCSMDYECVKQNYKSPKNLIKVTERRVFLYDSWGNQVGNLNFKDLKITPNV